MGTRMSTSSTGNASLPETAGPLKDAGVSVPEAVDTVQPPRPPWIVGAPGSPGVAASARPDPSESDEPAGSSGDASAVAAPPGDGVRAPSGPGPRLFLTAREVGQQLGIRKSRVYELASAGLLPVVRLGRRMLFPRRGLEELALAAIERAKAEMLSAGEGAFGPAGMARRYPTGASIPHRSGAGTRSGTTTGGGGTRRAA